MNTVSPSGRYDVIVAGIGTAGVMAAIAAAERGLRVLALEKNTYPGGTFTGGFITGFYQQPPDRMARAMHEAVLAEREPAHHTPNFVEPRKRRFEERALAAGATLVYGARVCGVDVADGRVRGVRWCRADGDGEERAEAPVVIDATAEAEACRLAGCPLEGGRAADRQFQPYTHTCLFRDGGHVFGGNFDAGYLEQHHAESFSRSFLRSSTLHLREDYREDRRIVMPADLPGIREGPHITPDRPVTLADLLDNDRDEAEPVAYVHANLDTHAQDLALESETLRDWLLGASLWGAELWFAVPRRSLHPVGPKGLLAAGRHLGVDHDLGHAARMNACMASLGETAGLLAAHAVRRGVAPDEVPYAAFAEELRLPPSPLPENRRWWGLSDGEILEGLASNKPGAASWSARRRGRRELLLTAYRDGAADGAGPLHRHAAMALALMGDGTGAATLRAMVRERDAYRPESSRKYNHARGYASIYLLGRLRDAESVGLLAEVLGDRRLDPAFLYRTCAVAALVAIGDAHEAERPNIGAALRAFAEDPSLRLAFPLKTCFLPVDHRFEGGFRIHVAAALNRWGLAHRVGEAFLAAGPEFRELRLATEAGVLE